MFETLTLDEKKHGLISSAAFMRKVKATIPVY